MRFILIGSVICFGLTEGGKKRPQAFEPLHTKQRRGSAQPTAGGPESTDQGISLAPPAVSASPPVPCSSSDEQTGPVRPLTRVDPQLLRILAYRPDEPFSESIREAEKFLGPGSRRIVIDWIELCLLPIHMHSLSPLQRLPCKAMDNGLMTLDDGLASALREKIDISLSEAVVSLDPAQSVLHHVWEVLRLYPDDEVGAIEATIQSVCPGAVVSADIVEPLRERMLFLTRIPFWLHLPTVKATLDRSLSSAKQLEEAVTEYAQEISKPVAEVGRMMVSWGILCVEPLFAWYNNPIGPMPCSMDDSGETISLSPAGRRTYNL